MILPEPKIQKTPASGKSFLGGSIIGLPSVEYATLKHALTFIKTDKVDGLGSVVVGKVINYVDLAGEINVVVYKEKKREKRTFNKKVELEDVDI